MKSKKKDYSMQKLAKLKPRRKIRRPNSGGIGLLPEWFRREYRRSDALPEPLYLMKGEGDGQAEFSAVEAVKAVDRVALIEPLRDALRKLVEDDGLWDLFKDHEFAAQTREGLEAKLISRVGKALGL